jgi:hypothetical protein
VLVLAARQRVQIQDRVEPVRGAGVHGALQQREPGIEVEQVMVVHREPDTVHAERGQVGGVAVGEEPPGEPGEQGVAGVGAHRRAQRRPLQGLRARVASDEVLHVQPAADSRHAQPAWGRGRRADPFRGKVFLVVHGVPVPAMAFWRFHVTIDPLPRGGQRGLSPFYRDVIAVDPHQPWGPVSAATGWKS